MFRGQILIFLLGLCVTYLEPCQSSPHLQHSSLYINFNNVFPSTFRSSRFTTNIFCEYPFLAVSASASPLSLSFRKLNAVILMVTALNTSLSHLNFET